jgi:hypothetical protein
MFSHHVCSICLSLTMTVLLSCECVSFITCGHACAHVPRARDFFPVGALYFDTNLDAGIEILGSARTFKLPARLDKLRLNIRIPAFSFTAWVRTSSQFQSGYIIRKQLAPSGLGEHLSVWGWWLRCVGCMWRRCLSVGERMLLSFLFWPPYVKVSTCLCGWTNSGVCVGVQCHIGAESPLWRP